MTHSIEGVVGKRSVDEVHIALKKNGSVEIPNPTYGYLGGSQIMHEKRYYVLPNGWIQSDLDEMIYVDRLGGGDIEMAFTCQVRGCACRYHTQYTRGVDEKGEAWGKLADSQINKVSAKKEIPTKQLEEGIFQKN